MAPSDRDVWYLTGLLFQEFAIGFWKRTSCNSIHQNMVSIKIQPHYSKMDHGNCYVFCWRLFGWRNSSFHPIRGVTVSTSNFPPDDLLPTDQSSPTKKNTNKNDPKNWPSLYLAIRCDLFGRLKWPLQRLSDLQLGDKKVTAWITWYWFVWNVWIFVSPTLFTNSRDCNQ